MKHVLILANGFPPHSGVEASRAAQLVKYLPDHGWHPHVACSQWTESNCLKFDPDFGGPKVKGFIVGTVAPPKDLTTVKSLPDVATKAMRLFSGYKNPASWSADMLRLVDEHLKTHTIDAVWATYPFRATLYVANQIHRTHGIPWVADFRDIFEQWSPKWQWGFERRNERATVRSASKLVTVSAALSHVLEQRHQRTVECLPNGFDPEDVETVEAKHDDGFFTIAHTGSIFPLGAEIRTSPGDLFAAVDDLAERSLITVDDFKLMFYGATEEELKPHLEGCACSHIVHTVPWLPRRDVTALQKGADLLLLLGTRMPGIVTAKLFEYLAAGRPIMATPSDDDAVDELLQRTRTGSSVTTTEEIADLLLKHYQAWKAGHTMDVDINTEEVARYSRRTQAGALAEWLNEITVQPR